MKKIEKEKTPMSRSPRRSGRSIRKSRSRRGSIRQKNELVVPSPQVKSNFSQVKKIEKVEKVEKVSADSERIRKKYISQSVQDVFTKVKINKSIKFKFQMSSSLCLTAIITLFDYFSHSKLNMDTMVYYK